jgi:quercetin dioxygenase-like cupin family protein
LNGIVFLRLRERALVFFFFWVFRYRFVKHTHNPPKKSPQMPLARAFLLARRCVLSPLPRCRVTARRSAAAADPASPLRVTRHADADLAGFLRAEGFGVTTVTLKPGHVMSGHAHNRPRKRLAVAAGRFVIAEGDATPSSNAAPAAVLTARDWTDIPAGWRHSAWVEGDEAVTLLIGDG